MIVTRSSDLTGLAALVVPNYRGALAQNAGPAEAPTKEPEVRPTLPDVEPEPNTVPRREPVQEPHVDPCERPDTTCPVHK